MVMMKMHFVPLKKKNLENYFIWKPHLATFIIACCRHWYPRKRSDRAISWSWVSPRERNMFFLTSIIVLLWFHAVAFETEEIESVYLQPVAVCSEIMKRKGAKTRWWPINENYKVNMAVSDFNIIAPRG